MAIDVVKAPSWRIGVEDAARVAPLRDYFRRLGLDPEDRGPLAFDVETSMPAGELEESIACWVNVNAIPVQLLPVKDEPASQPDALQPLRLPPPRIGELLVRKGFRSRSALRGA